jgi:predicted nucleic acid-binding protein
LSKKKGIAPAATDRLVIDSSIALSWCFTDEQSDYTQSVLDALASQSAIVPYLWHLEIANVLLVGERRSRCTQADTVHWLAFLSALPITIDDETAARAWQETLHLARAHNLSAYDAAYLELAIRRGLSLATLDNKLKAAAVAVGVQLFAVQ